MITENDKIFRDKYEKTLKDKVETVQFNKELMSEIKGYKFDSETKMTLCRLEEKCMSILEAKDADYGGSWQKDGIFSVHFNTKRKFDRLHNIFKNGFETTFPCISCICSTRTLNY